MGGDKTKRLADVRQMIVEAGMKKRWEPKDPERYLSDEVARDTALAVGMRFAWDRAWQPDRRKKGYVPPKPVEVEAPVQSEEEAWADEAAEITAQAAEQEAPEAAVEAPEAAHAEEAHSEEAEHHDEAPAEEGQDRNDDPLVEEKH